MNKTKLYQTLPIWLLSAMLLGCGDSNTSSEPTPNEEDKVTPVHDNIQVHVTPNTQFDTAISIYMGPWFPCSTEHPEMCLDPSQAVPLQQYSEKNGNNKMTRDPATDEFTVTAAELKAFANQTSKIPVDPTLFAPSQFSVLDVLIYLSEIRDDFSLSLGEFDPRIGSRTFTVSYDYNRDGQFNEADGPENFNNADWYAAFMYTDGEWKRMVGTAAIEPLYARLEEFIAKNDMHLRLRPFAPEMTQRRQHLQATEVSRLQDFGGKLVVPEVRVNFEDGRGFVTVAKDIEVESFNLRPDLFQSDVTTLMDVLMSATKQGKGEFGYTYWPTLSSKAEVGSYVMNSVNGKRGSGWTGWGLKSGEIKANDDFFYAPVYPTGQMLMAADQGTLADNLISKGIAAELANTLQLTFSGRCQWLLNDATTSHTPETAQICVDNWFGAFGGNNIHQNTDLAVMRYPKEAITLYWHTHMKGTFQVSQYNHVGDGLGEVYDISRAVSPLTSSHFGWGIADCGTCHSLESTHVSGDAPHLPSLVQPHFCASCHGSNGAPKGHGEEARCFFCHSEDKVMVNHGDASKRRPVSEAGCQGTTLAGANLDGLAGSCADHVAGTVSKSAVVTRERNIFSYQELVPDLTSLGNSDWNTSDTMPDPYSCVTCHPAN